VSPFTKGGAIRLNQRKRVAQSSSPLRKGRQERDLKREIERDFEKSV
jgi:hypothetical protein